MLQLQYVRNYGGYFLVCKCKYFNDKLEKQSVVNAEAECQVTEYINDTKYEIILVSSESVHTFYHFFPN